MANLFRLILTLAALPCLTIMLVACGNDSGALTSVYRLDRDNDGETDAVYRYTLDLSENQIKVEIDFENDGEVNQTCCYSLDTPKNHQVFLNGNGGRQSENGL